MRRFDLPLKLRRYFVKPREMRALEAQLLVVFVAVFQRKCLEFALRQVRSSGEIKFQNLIAGRNAFLTQIVLEGGHITGANAEDVQRFQFFEMHTLWPQMRQSAFQRESFALEANAAPKQLDDLRSFALAHVQKTHGRNAPTAPALCELSRTDEHIEMAISVVQCAEQRTAKVVTLVVEGIRILGKTEEPCVVANVDESERLAIAYPTPIRPYCF